MSDDKMRFEFEGWANEQGLSIARVTSKDKSDWEFACAETYEAWQVWQVAYTAGRQLVQKEKEDWPDSVFAEVFSSFSYLKARKISKVKPRQGDNLMERPLTFAVQIPVDDPQKMEQFQEMMDEIYDETYRYITDLADKLNVSEACASDIVYLRNRSRWTPELEQLLIQLHKEGTPPNIFEFP